MQKQSRRGDMSPRSVKKRTLQLSKEHIRTLTPEELPLAVGGSCPTTSWPNTQATVNTDVC